MSFRRPMIAFAFSFAAVLSGCESEPPASPPQVPYTFLANRVEEALQDLEDARSTMGGDAAPDAAERLENASVRLENASLRLRRVLDYYIPLLEARFQVARALELVAASAESSRAAIDSAGAIFEGISTARGERLAREMREPLARLDEARTALGQGRIDEARRVLGRLGEQLELLYFRGELVLEGSELDSLAPDGS